MANECLGVSFTDLCAVPKKVNIKRKPVPGKRKGSSLGVKRSIPGR